MALATKCPHCHTVFRVALDQLKLRGGIVRCGACNEIFDGNAALVAPAASAALDLDLDLALESSQNQNPAVPAPVPVSTLSTDHADDADPADPADLSDPADHAAEPATRAPVPDERREPGYDIPSEHIVAVALDELHHFNDGADVEAPDARESGHAAAEPVAGDAERDDNVHALVPDADHPDGQAVDDAPAWKSPAEAEPEAFHDPDDEPDFVRQAHRRQRTSELARRGMIAGVPLLAVLLLGQGVFTLRNSLAADHPALKPALQALCVPLGCKVDLPRQIDTLAIEQGELQTLAPDTFSYITVLRNQSRSLQAWPHLELVLNDTADKPVLRRVFAPRDYLPRTELAQGFRPRSEQSVKLYFRLAGPKASGYHIAIFHP
jgi:predicted Zn finger-like uncharacterized protein